MSQQKLTNIRNYRQQKSIVWSEKKRDSALQKIHNITLSIININNLDGQIFSLRFSYVPFCAIFREYAMQ